MLAFRGEQFWSYTLQLIDPTFDAAEQHRRAAHDTWLESFLGPAHEVDEAHHSKAYRFAWGTLHSSYDPRSDSSDIGVTFSG